MYAATFIIYLIKEILKRLLNLRNSLEKYYCYSHFTDEKTEVRGVK